MGASLALPFWIPWFRRKRRCASTAASSRTRLVCIEMVHGAAGSTDEGDRKHYWSPEKEGVDFDFSYSLEPLAPFRDCITIVTGTDAAHAEPSRLLKEAPIISAPARCFSPRLTPGKLLAPMS